MEFVLIIVYIVFYFAYESRIFEVFNCLAHLKIMDEEFRQAIVIDCLNINGFDQSHYEVEVVPCAYRGL